MLVSNLGAGNEAGVSKRAFQNLSKVIYSSLKPSWHLEPPSWKRIQSKCVRLTIWQAFVWWWLFWCWLDRIIQVISLSLSLSYLSVCLSLHWLFASAHLTITLIWVLTTIGQQKELTKTILVYVSYFTYHLTTYARTVTNSFIVSALFLMGWLM